MSEPIKVGDLVYVARLCCAAYLDGDSPIFQVVKFSVLPSYVEKATCGHCKAALPLEPRGAATMSENGVPVSWLKRIPPLFELDDVRQDEEITA